MRAAPPVAPAIIRYKALYRRCALLIAAGHGKLNYWAAIHGSVLSHAEKLLNADLAGQCVTMGVLIATHHSEIQLEPMEPCDTAI